MGSFETGTCKFMCPKKTGHINLHVPKRRFVIASGPTEEPIDPVRFISNRSTGTMGRCLAQAARRKGYAVIWIQCPKDARTALDLKKKLQVLVPQSDCFIMAAAVCDARPVFFAKRKIKKAKLRNIQLVKNPDILAGLPKKKGQVFIGFGIESGDIFENGFKKLVQKKLDRIVLQKVTARRDPFGDKRIDALVMDKDKRCAHFRSATKARIAGYLIQEAERLLRISRKFGG